MHELEKQAGCQRELEIKEQDGNFMRTSRVDGGTAASPDLCFLSITATARLSHGNCDVNFAVDGRIGPANERPSPAAASLTQRPCGIRVRPGPARDSSSLAAWPGTGHDFVNLSVTGPTTAHRRPRPD